MGFSIDPRYIRHQPLHHLHCEQESFAVEAEAFLHGRSVRGQLFDRTGPTVRTGTGPLAGMETLCRLQNDIRDSNTGL